MTRREMIGAWCFIAQMCLAGVAIVFVFVPWPLLSILQTPHFLLDASLLVLVGAGIGQLLPMIALQFCGPSRPKRVLSLVVGLFMPLIAISDLVAILMGGSAL